MEDKDLEYIERYFRNDLNAAEQADFRQRMAGDPAFREAVQLHEDALTAIRAEGESQIRARLAAKGREMDAQQPQKNRHTGWWWLPVLLLCVGGAWWIVRVPVPDNTAPSQPVVPQTAPVIPKDTLPEKTPPTPQTPEKKLPPPIPETQQVFAAWFSPYKDDSLEPSVRGDGTPSPSQQFQQLYWDGKYRQALAAFEKMEAATQDNDNLLFLKANCLLVLGHAKEAIPALETILRNDRSRFMDQTKWYLALARLCNGEKVEARTLLQEIAADPDSPRKNDAARVLKSL